MLARSLLAALAALILGVLGSVAPAQAQRSIAGLTVPSSASSLLLSDADLGRYREILAATSRGNWSEADALIERLDDRRLVGRMLLERYMHADYRTSLSEMLRWLEQHADTAGADRVYRLAMDRRGRRDPVPNRPARDIAELLDAAIVPCGDNGFRDSWEAGIAAWQLGQNEAAVAQFRQVAAHRCASVSFKAGAELWTARALWRANQPAAATEALHRAVTVSPRSFYGLVAARMLGLDHSFSFAAPSLTAAHWAALAADPSARRAAAYLQLSRPELAERELMLSGNDDLARVRLEGLLALAQEARLPRAAFTLARLLATTGLEGYDGAYYPFGSYTPDASRGIDLPLLYAVMRQESAFNPNAVSHAGARGLMQLMPRTASGLDGVNYRRGGNTALLNDPATNLRLGQEYLQLLQREPGIGNNLIRMLAGYNAGPGNVARWVASLPVDDPLLFIESMHLAETRLYVQRVLAGMWVYQMRLGQPHPGLDAIAAGQWPAYIAQASGEVAEHAGD